MKRICYFVFLAFMTANVWAEDVKIASPDGKVNVTVTDQGGIPTYMITYDGRVMLKPSRLGLKASIGDFTAGITIKGQKQNRIDQNYEMTRIKTSQVHYVATEAVIAMQNAQGWPLTVTFRVSNHDVAFRYTLHRGQNDTPRCALVYSETSAFNFPQHTTTFICPQSKPMDGWERTKPSYEEEYKADAAMDLPSQYGQGYTFPCLFHVGNDGWVLVSETGTGSNYVGCHLSDYQKDLGYTIAFPNQDEMNGMGSPYAGIPLPGSTPWRTITMGTTLKPIVETTIPYDLVEPLYQPTHKYKPGRYTWSWLIWQDESCNYDDQVQFVDLAATMGYEYCLVDALWDQRIGREGIEKLSRYACSKGVRLMLWYNSNGMWNDAPQSPVGCMNTSWAREREMKWMEENRIAGIKVDFFGGDKQEMMKLYEDILVDANRHGLQVIFHGCTLPRGWERMYPNYVASEAMLASENVYFTEHHARQEGFELCTYPFTRNAVGSADWGGVLMNTHMSRDNKSRHPRYTSNVFEMASALIMQSSINAVVLCPNNLSELQPFELDFLRELPTTWDETRFLDGYPTRYVALARRHGNKWYVGALNGTQEPISMTLDLSMFANQTMNCLTDQPLKKSKKAQDNAQQLPTPVQKQLKVPQDGKVQITIQPMGGIIIR